VAPPEYLERVVRTCRERDILLVYDNAYSELAFDGYVPPSIFEFEGAREVAIEFHSMSKTYNMTGWRIGWAAGASPLIAALARVKTYVDTGTSLLVQAAAQAALASYDDWVPQNVERFRERRDAAAAALRAANLVVTRVRYPSRGRCPRPYLRIISFLRNSPGRRRFHSRSRRVFRNSSFVDRRGGPNVVQPARPALQLRCARPLHVTRDARISP
jgi:hypothetical protein